MIKCRIHNGRTTTGAWQHCARIRSVKLHAVLLMSTFLSGMHAGRDPRGRGKDSQPSSQGYSILMATTPTSKPLLVCFIPLSLKGSDRRLRNGPVDPCMAASMFRSFVHGHSCSSAMSWSTHKSKTIRHLCPSLKPRTTLHGKRSGLLNVCRVLNRAIHTSYLG